MSRTKSAAECFVNDKESLYRLFCDDVSFEFTHFADCWKRMRFGLVLYGRRKTGLMEYLTNCYTAVRPDLMISNPCNRRVFALFLLYSLYHRVPFKSDRLPIRIPISMLNDLTSLKEEAVRQNHTDVLFVYHNLMSSGAIQIVHTAELYGPTQIRSYSSIPVYSVNETRRQLEQPASELLNLNSQYEDMKRMLAADNCVIGDLIQPPETDQMRIQTEKIFHMKP